MSLQAHSHGCWQDSVLGGLMNWGLPSVPAGSGTLPSVPCHVRVSIQKLTHGAFLHPSKHTSRTRERDRETASKTEVIAFYKLPLTVTSYPLCRVLFIRGKSRGPAHTHRERIAWTRDYRESGITGVGSGSSSPTLLYTPLKAPSFVLFLFPLCCFFLPLTLLLLFFLFLLLTQHILLCLTQWEHWAYR